MPLQQLCSIADVNLQLSNDFCPLYSGWTLVSEGDIESPIPSTVIPRSCVLRLKSQDGAVVGKLSTTAAVFAGCPWAGG